jgi:integrase
MSAPYQQSAPSNGKVPPAEWHESGNGERFNLYSDRWQLSARMSVNIGSLRCLCWSPVLADGAVRTMAEYAHKAASGTVSRLATAVRQFLESVPTHLRTDEISYSAVLSYRESCWRRDGHDGIFASCIRPFLRIWNTLGYPGVSGELLELMDTWALKNPEKGVAVNRMDANEGPLMPDEHASLAANWLTAFEHGTMTLTDYVMVRLCSVTGRRPEQIMQLKLKDLDGSRFEDLEPGRPPRNVLLLHIPRIKSKGGEWRTRFRAVPISNELWNLLIMQRDDMHRRLDDFLKTCGLSLQPHDLTLIRAEMPLIPAWQVIETFAKELRITVARGRHVEAINELRALASSDAWHGMILRIGLALRSSIKKAALLNCDGEPLHVFPRRLRYTREFDLERAGCVPSVIAWNMDHSNTQSLMSYSKNGPDRARSLSSAMALKLAPFVRMFQGRVVNDESEAEGGDDPAASRILFENLTPGATCAVKRGCSMSAIPRPCYNGCPHFRPWVDGPHEKFLESLLEERERSLRLLRPIEDRAVIEAADSLIINVVQVIRLCNSRRLELAGQNKSASATR